MYFEYWQEASPSRQKVNISDVCQTNFSSSSFLTVISFCGRPNKTLWRWPLALPPVDPSHSTRAALLCSLDRLFTSQTPATVHRQQHKASASPSTPLSAYFSLPAMQTMLISPGVCAHWCWSDESGNDSSIWLRMHESLYRQMVIWEWRLGSAGGKV